MGTSITLINKHSSFVAWFGTGIARFKELNDRPFIQNRKGHERRMANMLMEKQKKPMPSTLMTVKDVATYLSVTERTVYRLVKDHRLPAYKVGGQWRFKADMIEAWMQKDGALDSLAESASDLHPATAQYA